MAICRYFEAVQPDPPLLGRDAREQALVTSFQRRAEFDGMIATSEVFRNQHEQFTERSLPGAGDAKLPAIPGLVDRGRGTLTRFFAWLEARLTEHAFVAGEIFTMADITAFCAVDFASWVDIGIPPGNARSLDWYQRVAARPSARA